MHKGIAATLVAATIALGGAGALSAQTKTQPTEGDVTTQEIVLTSCSFGVITECGTLTTTTCTKWTTVSVGGGVTVGAGGTGGLNASTSFVCETSVTTTLKLYKDKFATATVE